MKAQVQIRLDKSTVLHNFIHMRRQSTSD